MRLLFIVISLIAFQSQAQIWKQPYDTLLYIDNLSKAPKGFEGKVRSYTVTQFDSLDSIIRYDYYGFNEKGWQVEQFYSMHPSDNADTVYFRYNKDGICQERMKKIDGKTSFRRWYEFNDQNRLTGVCSSEVLDLNCIEYFYNSENQLDSIFYSPNYWVTYSYLNSKLKRKEVWQNGKLKEYFNYSHPKKRILVYQHCYINEKGDTYEPCEVTEGYFDKEERLMRIVNKYDLDSNNVFVTTFKRDRKGKIKLMTDKALNDESIDSRTVYIRNKKGLLVRVEHYILGKLMMHSEFDYTFY